jgi:hypothetical protein
MYCAKGGWWSTVFESAGKSGLVIRLSFLKGFPTGIGAKAWTVQAKVKLVAMRTDLRHMVVLKLRA